MFNVHAQMYAPLAHASVNIIMALASSKYYYIVLAFNTFPVCSYIANSEFQFRCRDW